MKFSTFFEFFFLSCTRKKIRSITFSENCMYFTFRYLELDVCYEFAHTQKMKEEFFSNCNWFLVKSGCTKIVKISILAEVYLKP